MTAPMDRYVLDAVEDSDEHHADHAGQQLSTPKNQLRTGSQRRNPILMTG